MGHHLVWSIYDFFSMVLWITCNTPPASGAGKSPSKRRDSCPGPQACSLVLCPGSLSGYLMVTSWWNSGWMIVFHGNFPWWLIEIHTDNLWKFNGDSLPWWMEIFPHGWKNHPCQSSGWNFWPADHGILGAIIETVKFPCHELSLNPPFISGLKSRCSCWEPCTFVHE